MSIHMYLISVHTYVLPCPYVFYTYMIRVSNSYELELVLPRMCVPLTSIVKMFPKVRYCFRFCSHSDSKIRQGWMQKFMWEVLNCSSVCFGNSMRPGCYSQILYCFRFCSFTHMDPKIRQAGDTNYVRGLQLKYYFGNPMPPHPSCGC